VCCCCSLCVLFCYCFVFLPPIISLYLSPRSLSFFVSLVFFPLLLRALFARLSSFRRKFSPSSSPVISSFSCVQLEIGVLQPNSPDHKTVLDKLVAALRAVAKRSRPSGPLLISWFSWIMSFLQLMRDKADFDVPPLERDGIPDFRVCVVLLRILLSCSCSCSCSSCSSCSSSRSSYCHLFFLSLLSMRRFAGRPSTLFSMIISLILLPLPLSLSLLSTTRL
jgi:hypothetical protein